MIANGVRGAIMINNVKEGAITLSETHGGIDLL